MSDQADGLRQLVRARRGATGVDRRPTGIPRRLLLVGAKGGVGTSCLAANLAIALAARGRHVGAVALGSTRPHLGLLLGAETRAVATRGGVRLLDPKDLETVCQADELVVDAGTDFQALQTAQPGTLVVVTTPEPPSLAEARVLLRRLAATGREPVRLVVNQADHAAEARECLSRLIVWCRLGLGLSARRLGHVRRDPRVARSVRAGRPFVLAHPRGPAARDVTRLALRLVREASSLAPDTATSGQFPAAPPPK